MSREASEHKRIASGPVPDRAPRPAILRTQENRGEPRSAHPPRPAIFDPTVEYVIGVTHLVLSRKYRPQRFEDLVGQEHVARTLSNAIASGRVGHAYLFVGPRGTGK